MQGKAKYIRPKVVEPFPRPCASRSYMNKADRFSEARLWIIVALNF
jgi:hypothetical protein